MKNLNNPSKRGNRKERRQDWVRQTTRRIKYDYLSECGAQGGTPYGFILHAEEWLDQNQELALEHAKDLFLGVCQKTWGEKLSKASPDQENLELDGDPLPLELKYRPPSIHRTDAEDIELELLDSTDETAGEPEYITVLTCFASLEQFRLAWQEVQRNANNQIRAASRMFEQYQGMLKLAKGNEQRLVVDLLSPSLAPEPEPA